MDSFTGEYTEQVPIALPRFHGVEPAIRLEYRSSAPNGVAGMGWRIAGATRLVRSGARGGTPQYDTSDTFLLDGVELIPCSAAPQGASCRAGGTHTSKFENYLRIERSTASHRPRARATTWMLTTKDGIRIILAPLDHPLDDALVRVWGVSKVVDLFGNQVDYRWDCQAYSATYEPACRLQQISYGKVLVSLAYENRPDLLIHATGQGLRVDSLRLSKISTAVNRSLIQEHRLSYQQSGVTGKSLLDQVRTFDYTGSRAFPRPPYKFTYASTAHPAWQTSSPTEPALPEFLRSVYTEFGDTCTRIVDLNGDGLPDVLQVGGTHRRAWLRDGRTLKRSDTWAEGLPNLCIGPEGGPDNGVRFDEINGDGFVDIVQAYAGVQSTGGGNTSVRAVWLNNGVDRFVRQALTYALNPPCDFGTFPRHDLLPDTGCRLADLNSDGRADVVIANQYRTGSNALVTDRRAWLNTGSGWLPKNVLATGIPIFSKEGVSTDAVLVDLNGDGLVDVTGTATRTLNTGGGFAPASEFFGSLPQFTSRNTKPADQGVRFGDLTGDGLVDFVQLYRGTRVERMHEYTHAAVFINGGSRFIRTEISPPKTGLYESFFSYVHAQNPKYDFGMIIGDFNGDGIADLKQAYRGTVSDKPERNIIANYDGKFAMADLLSRVSDGAGVVKHVTYAPARGVDSAGEFTKHQDLPLAVTVVASVEVRISHREVAKYNYEYSGGLYDRADRRFLGFRKVIERLPSIDEAESNRPELTTHFLMDYGSLAKPEVIEFRDEKGLLRRQDRFAYASSGASLPYWSHETEHTAFEFAAGERSAARGTGYRRTYDEFGNVEIEQSLGDWDVTGDEKTLEFRYFHNLSSYVIGKPAATTIYKGVSNSSVMLAQTRYYYDENPSWSMPPGRGKLTKADQWESESNTYVQTAGSKFDRYGNLIEEWDALGQSTRYVIDPTYHLFVEAVINAKGQKLVHEWDKERGRKTRSIDSNGDVITFGYHPDGRLARVVAANGLVTEHAYSYVFGDSQRLIPEYLVHEVVMRDSSAVDASAVAETELINGAGEVFHAQKGIAPADPRRPPIVMLAVQFDAAGRVRTKNTSARYRDRPPLDVRFSYDHAGRLVRAEQSDGSIEKRQYGLGTMTVVDQAGRRRDLSFDAFGRLTRDCHVAGIGESLCTRRSYDLLGNLTEVTDAGGHRLVIDRNSLGWRTRVVDPDWGTTAYRHAATGLLSEYQTADGTRHKFAYDALNRPVSETVSAADGRVQSREWIYDTGPHGIGRLSGQRWEGGESSLEYDSAGLPVRTCLKLNGTQRCATKGYGLSGQVLWTRYPDGDAIGTAETPLRYDEFGRLIAIPGIVDSIAYGADGQREEVRWHGGAIERRQYSPVRRWLTSIAFFDAGVEVYAVDLRDRNLVGQLMSERTPAGAFIKRYQYDGYGRLSGWTGGAGEGSSAVRETFEYDDCGSLVRKGDQLLKYDAQFPHRLIEIAGQKITHDGLGRVLSAPDTSIQYDLSGRAVVVNQHRLSHDADGNRVSHIDGAGTEFVHLGPSYEESVSGTLKYVWIGGAVGAVRVCMGGTCRSMPTATDARGSVVRVGAGTYASRDYAPYGELTAASALGTAKIRGFAGHRADLGAEIVDMNARLYSPLLGQFLQPDVSTGDVPGSAFNRYAYASSDPVNHIDVSGYGFAFSAYHWDNYWRTKWFALQGRVPLIGRQLEAYAALGLMADPMYLTTGDTKGWARAFGTGGVVVASHFLSAWAGGQLNPAVRVGMSVLISSATSGAIAAINNSRDPEDFQRSVLSGAGWGLAAGLLREVWIYTAADEPTTPLLDPDNKGSVVMKPYPSGPAGTGLPNSNVVGTYNRGATYHTPGWADEGFPLTAFLARAIPYFNSFAQTHDGLVNLLNLKGFWIYGSWGFSLPVTYGAALLPTGTMEVSARYGGIDSGSRGATGAALVTNPTGQAIGVDHGRWLHGQ